MKVLKKTIKNKYAFVAEKFNIARSMVCKWKKQQDELKKEAEKLKTKKSRTGVGSSRTTRTGRLIRKYCLKQYPLAEQVIVTEFNKQKSVGLKVSGR